MKWDIIDQKVWHDFTYLPKEGLELRA